MGKIKIIIADDHPLIRRGLIWVLRQNKNFIVSAEFGNGEETLNYIESNQPDIAILDIEMPGLSGFDIAYKLKEKNIEVKIVILTMYKDKQMFNEAIELGALGYILKENAVEDIVECINQVYKGNYYISPAISNLLIKRKNELKTFSQKFLALKLLTTTERSILNLIAKNYTSKQIADKMHISVKTVENHRYNISKKLDLKGTHSLLKFALENKNFL